MKKSLVIGSKGFIGANLCAHLGEGNTIEFNVSPKSGSVFALADALKQHDGPIYHVAGATKDSSLHSLEFDVNLMRTILSNKRAESPMVYASSVRKLEDTTYGIHKRHLEDIINQYNKNTKVVDLPNIFGKWGRPNHNSIVATWCHQLAMGLPLTDVMRHRELSWLHVDQAVNNLLRGESFHHSFFYRLGQLRRRLERCYKDVHHTSTLRWFHSDLRSTLYSYMAPSALPTTDSHRNSAGMFAEFTKKDDGQVNYLTTEPGQVRGNHWHHNRIEKFVLQYPTDVLICKNIKTDETMQFKGGPTEVLVPPTWAHRLENRGDRPSITLLWSSCVFDPSNPDTVKYKYL